MILPRVLIVSLATLSASAQQDRSPPEAPLAGPQVGVHVQTGKSSLTLVRREFDGRLMRIESEPVAAAIAIMELSPADRQRADKVLLDRAVAIDRLLQDNMRLVLELQNAFQPGDDGDGQRALASLYEQAKPIFLKGQLVDLVAAQLPADQARELKRIVDDYRQAGIQDRMTRGEQKDRFGAFLAENFTNFQKELEASGKRVFEGGDKDFAELSKKLDLTTEQEAKIQNMYLDMVAKSKGKPSKNDGLKVILQAMQLLSPEQKQKLREIIAQEAREAGQRAAAEKRTQQQTDNPKGK